MNIAILGGTGKEGAGLAARWALAGHSIVIGSRDAERAKTKAAELREATHKMAITGESNAEAARQGTVIVIALPAQGLAATLPEVRDGCRGKVVISTVVPLTFGGPRLFTPPPAGSSAEEAQGWLPAPGRRSPPPAAARCGPSRRWPTERGVDRPHRRAPG